MFSIKKKKVKKKNKNPSILEAISDLPKSKFQPVIE